MKSTKIYLQAHAFRGDNGAGVLHRGVTACKAAYDNLPAAVHRAWQRWWRLPQELQLVCAAMGLAVSSLALSMLIVA
ncbi:MAG: hypothetical protein EOO22_05715, partial [Comamonadaceae bacterium]